MNNDRVKERIKKIRLSLQCYEVYSKYNLFEYYSRCVNFLATAQFSFAVILSAVALLFFNKINLEIR